MTSFSFKPAGGVARAALVAAMALPLAPAHADPTAADLAGGEGKVMVLVEVGTAFHVIDAPAPAADGAAGDLGLFESNLLRDNLVVGTLAGQCVQLRADGSLDQCTVVVTVGANSFVMTGLFDPLKGGTLAITGGTGAWVGAAGTDSIVNRPDGTAVHTIRLKRR